MGTHRSVSRRAGHVVGSPFFLGAVTSTDPWLFSTASMVKRGEKWMGTHRSVSRRAGHVVGSPFFLGAVTVQFC
jgi:hypothetical protein